MSAKGIDSLTFQAKKQSLSFHKFDKENEMQVTYNDELLNNSEHYYLDKDNVISLIEFLQEQLKTVSNPA